MVHPISRAFRGINRLEALGGLLLGVAGQPWFWWQPTDARLGYSAPDLLSVSLVVIAALAISLFEICPLASTLVCWIAFLTYTSAGNIPTPLSLGALAVLALFICKARQRVWLSVSLLILIAAVLSAFTRSQGKAAEALLSCFVVGVTIGIGYLIKVTLSNNRLSAEIVKVERAERRATANLHIAAEIHDLLGHDLSLLALNIEVARLTTAKDPSSVDQVLESLAQRTRSAMGSLSDLVLNLSQDQGIKQVKLLADPFRDIVPLVNEIVISANSAGLEISFVCQDHRIIANDTICDAIVHLAKEAITNLSKHSVSNKGVLTLSRSSLGIHLEVLDGGPIDTHSQRRRHGTGLINCQKRAQLLGGWAGFSLVPGSNKGSFTAFIPWTNAVVQ